MQINPKKKKESLPGGQFGQSLTGVKQGIIGLEKIKSKREKVQKGGGKHIPILKREKKKKGREKGGPWGWGLKIPLN